MLNELVISRGDMKTTAEVDFFQELVDEMGFTKERAESIDCIRIDIRTAITRINDLEENTVNVRP